MNRSVTRRCWVSATAGRRFPSASATFCRARWASWRQDGVVRPTVSAIVENGNLEDVVQDVDDPFRGGELFEDDEKGEPDAVVKGDAVRGIAK